MELNTTLLNSVNSTISLFSDSDLDNSKDNTRDNSRTKDSILNYQSTKNSLNYQLANDQPSKVLQEHDLLSEN